MPATSLKQKKFMDAVAHNPAFAKKVGVPKSVGKDFSEASKGMKFGKGTKSRAEDGKGKMAHGGMAKKMAKGGGIEAKGKTKGAQVKMSGSKPLGMKMGGKAC